MALVRERDGRRLHVKSKLMGESLVSKSFVENLKIAPQQRLFPDVNILKIGGQSICDRGIKAIPSIIKEIVANKDKHKMLITTGGGTRSRHIYSIGLELGMPTGIIAKFGSSISEQNALLISALLSPWGGIKIGHDEVVKLSIYFAQDCIPVMHGMPPYDYFSIQYTERMLAPYSSQISLEPVAAFLLRMKKDCTRTIPRSIQKVNLFLKYEQLNLWKRT